MSAEGAQGETWVKYQFSPRPRGWQVLSTHPSHTPFLVASDLLEEDADRIIAMHAAQPTALQAALERAEAELARYRLQGIEYEEAIDTDNAALEAQLKAAEDARDEAVKALRLRCLCPQTVHYSGGEVEWVKLTGHNTACPQHGALARLDKAAVQPEGE